jgi:hypothetical protein
MVVWGHWGAHFWGKDGAHGCGVSILMAQVGQSDWQHSNMRKPSGLFQRDFQPDKKSQSSSSKACSLIWNTFNGLN